MKKRCTPYAKIFFEFFWSFVDNFSIFEADHFLDVKMVPCVKMQDENHVSCKFSTHFTWLSPNVILQSKLQMPHLKTIQTQVYSIKLNPKLKKNFRLRRTIPCSPANSLQLVFLSTISKNMTDWRKRIHKKNKNRAHFYSFQSDRPICAFWTFSSRVFKMCIFCHYPLVYENFIFISFYDHIVIALMN